MKAEAKVDEQKTAQEREYTSQQKAALVAWHLAHGEAMTTANVATLTGLDRVGAWKLMCMLSNVIPIYQDDAGLWQVTALRELECIPTA